MIAKESLYGYHKLLCDFELFAESNEYPHYSSPLDFMADFMTHCFNLLLFQPLNLCDIEHVCSVVVTKEDQISQKVSINLKDPEKEVMPIAGFSF